MLDEIFSLLLDNLITLRYEETARRLPLLPRFLVHLITFAIVFGAIWFMIPIVRPFFSGSGVTYFMAAFVCFVVILLSFGIIGRIVVRIMVEIWPTKE